MPDQDARVRCTQGTRGENIFHFLCLQNLGTRQTRIAGPASDHERENYFVQAGAEECRKSNRQQDSWEREKGVDQHYVDEAIEPSAEIARHRTDREPDESRAE